MERQLRDTEIDERIPDRLSAIIYSMTKEERSKPNIINASRKKRIAAGCGMKVEDVNRLLKQYEQMQKMMKQMGLTGSGKNGKGKRKMPKMPAGFNNKDFMKSLENFK